MIFTSRHFVIIIYAVLILCAVLLLYSNSVVGNKKDECAKLYTWLYLFLPIRLIIKLIYFYVEYYVRSWPLSLGINLAMDTSYVISILLCIAIIGKRAGRTRDWKQVLQLIVSVVYVAGFFLISYVWISPETNVNIVFPGGMVDAVYIAIEALFAAVSIFNAICCWNASHKLENRTESTVLLLNIVWYVIYVFIWDISFIVPIPIRNTKPLDGVLLFTAVIIGLYFLPLNQQTRVIANKSVDVHGKSVSEIAKEAHLTERETEIFEHLLKGSTYNEIGETIFVSPNTVKKYCGSIYAKFEVKNRSQLSALVSEKMAGKTSEQ